MHIKVCINVYLSWSLKFEFSWAVLVATLDACPHPVCWGCRHTELQGALLCCLLRGSLVHGARHQNTCLLSAPLVTVITLICMQPALSPERLSWVDEARS